jgi:hypothetical protein
LTPANDVEKCIWYNREVERAKRGGGRETTDDFGDSQKDQRKGFRHKEYSLTSFPEAGDGTLQIPSKGEASKHFRSDPDLSRWMSVTMDPGGR